MPDCSKTGDDGAKHAMLCANTSGGLGMSAKRTARCKGLRRGSLGRVILAPVMIALLSGGVAPPLAAETVNILRPVARSAAPDPAETETPAAAPIEPAPAVPGEDGTAGPDLATAAPINLYEVSPPARNGVIPRTRWQHRRGHAVWTRTALSALKSHGKPLVDMVPADIDDWCPAYPTASDADRRAFWVGFMSALAKHESTYKARAVGGGRSLVRVAADPACHRARLWLQRRHGRGVAERGREPELCGADHGGHRAP